MRLTLVKSLHQNVLLLHSQQVQRTKIIAFTITESVITIEHSFSDLLIDPPKWSLPLPSNMYT